MESLPNLNALRAFEATARQGTVSAAADELHVSPSAVSQQLKTLESQLGVILFHRVGRRNEITADGQALLVELTKAFGTIHAAVRRARLAKHGTQILNISCAPIFASKWLIPRLHRFTELHSGIDVRLSASLELVDFSNEEFDAAIRLGHGNYPGLRCEVIFDDSIQPMCSPKILAEEEPFRMPGDVLKHPLIHIEWASQVNPKIDWAAWLADAKVDYVPELHSGLSFSNPDNAMQAAIEGLGIVLGWTSLAKDDIKNKRLVTPYSLEIPMSPKFLLVYPEIFSERPALQMFSEWLLSETERV